MAWVYTQRSGKMTADGGQLLAIGYSGHDSGKNDPAAEATPRIGPIPCGRYVIGPPEDTPTHGPYVLRLTPDASNQMHGRSGFLIHGDSVKSPGTASLGCIILPRFARQRIWESGDHVLEVISGDPVVDPEIGV